MELAYRIDRVFQQISVNGHAADGLMFTETDAPYEFGTCQSMIKWKPAEENTVDFLLRRDFKEGQPSYYICVFHGEKGYIFESDFDFGQEELQKYFFSRSPIPDSREKI